MSREIYIERSFSAASTAIIQTANDICENYAQQGYDLSLRQLYYQFVSRALLPNTEQNYKRLGSIISDARLAGLLDWDYIKDRGRETTQNSHWNNPGEILDACAKQFRVDLWKGQPNHVEVMVEKQALEGVLEPVCKKLDIPFTANKGYSSSSAMYEVAQRLLDKSRSGMDLHIIYLGDHDPSGIDMTRDVTDRLSLFVGIDVEVHRVALNMDQVDEYNPPENPAKLTDSRANAYIARFGDSSWELDALEPSLLAQIVTSQVEELRDDDLYEQQKRVQATWRTELRKMARKYSDT